MSNSVIHHSTLSEKVARTDVLVLLTHFSPESRKHHVFSVSDVPGPGPGSSDSASRDLHSNCQSIRPMSSQHLIKLLLTSVLTVQISNYNIIFVIPYKKSEIKSFGKCASLQRSILKIQSQSIDMLKGFFGL